jgi:hypothetical protein
MPLISEVKFDELLTNISVQYQPAQGGFLADIVGPPVPVRLESSVYWKYDKSRFDVPNSARAPRSEYNRVEWTATRDSYLAEEYGLELPIDDRERDNAAGPLDLDIDSTEIVTDMVLNNREKRWADMVMDPAIVTQTTDLNSLAGRQWDDFSSGVSDPLGDAAIARNAIWLATGYRPNKLLLGYQVAEKLAQHPGLLERIQFSERALITKQILAALFQVDEVIIGGVLQRTSAAGATDVLADVWGKNALFFYSETRPSLKRASFAYTFRVKALQAFRYREEKIKSDIIRVTEIQAEKMVAPELGYLFQNAID